MRIILASASPRRKELLKKFFPDFEIFPTNVDEELRFKRPSRAAAALAEVKADAVCVPDALVIAADTLVWRDGKFYGKPKNEADAKRTLAELSGKGHYVYTGVCLKYGGKKRVFYDRAEVYFNDLSQSFIDDYVAGGSPLDKAGAYGIQDGGIVKRYVGDYATIVGLPDKKLREELDAFFGGKGVL